MPPKAPPKCVFVETPAVTIASFRHFRFQLEKIFDFVRIEDLIREDQAPQADLLIIPESGGYPDQAWLDWWMASSQARIAVMLRLVPSDTPQSEDQRVQYFEKPLDQAVQDDLIQRIRNWVDKVVNR